MNILQVRTGASTLRNLGDDGTVLQSSNGSGGVPVTTGGPTGRQRFVSDMLGANISNLYFMVWPNDLRYTGNPTDFNVTGYTRDFRQVLNGMIEAGIAASTIYLGSPTWYDTTHYAIGGAGFTGSNDTINQSYRQATLDLATEYGTKYADVYAAIQPLGLSAFVAADVHWNDLGHATGADAFTAATTPNVKPKTTALVTSSSGVGQLGLTWAAPVSGTVTNYTVQHGIDGTYDYATTQNVAGLSGAWTGLAGGSYRLRVRANFNDGTSSPWAYASAVQAVAAAGGTTFFTDTFTDTNGTLLTAHTSDSGVGWALGSGATQTGGAPTLTGGRVYSTGTAGVWRAQTISPSADYTVTALYDFVAASGGENSGFCGRMDPAANTYYWARWNSSGWSLFKTVAGTATQLGSTVADTFTSGSRTADLVMNGSTISLKVDGATIISVTDTAITGAGSPGLRPLNQTSTTARQITSLTAVTL